MTEILVRRELSPAHLDLLRAIGAGEVRGFVERPNSRNGTWGQRDLWEPTDSLSTVSVTSTIKGARDPRTGRASARRIPVDVAAH